MQTTRLTRSWAKLTAKGFAPPLLDLHSGPLAGQCVGQDAITLRVFVAARCADIIHTIIQIYHRINLAVAGFKRPVRIPNNTAGVCFFVQGYLSLGAFWALSATPSTCL